MEMEGHIQSLLLQRYDNPFKDQLCCDSKKLRLVKCHSSGCSQYPVSCEDCFVKYHRHNPFHWALVWDTTRGFWQKQDYTNVIDSNFIQIGHLGEEPCPNASNPIEFIITHTNGVHSSRIKYCRCLPLRPEVDQLITADLFPATLNEPRSAFTIALLKEFHMHNFQSKCGAFDYIMSIRRMTDNTFTASVPVSLVYLHWTSLTYL